MWVFQISKRRYHTSTTTVLNKYKRNIWMNFACCFRYSFDRLIKEPKSDAHIHIATTNNRSTYLFVFLNFTQHQLRYQITMPHKWKSFFCTIKFNNSMHAISYKNILFQIFGNLHPKMRSVVLLSIFAPELHTFVFVLV